MTPLTKPANDGGGAAPAPLAGQPRLLERLESVLGAPVEILPEVGSTNEELSARAREAAGRRDPLPDLTLLATDFQSAGRGRLDRNWLVAPGEALTFSLLLHPGAADGTALPARAYGWLTMLMAGAVVQALHDDGVPARIKWPNDVLVDGRKLVGILASLVTLDGLPPAVVIGAGINVTTSQLPVETATSVSREGGSTDRGRLLESVLEKFVPLYRRFCQDPGRLTRPDGSLRRAVEQDVITLGSSVRAELPGAQAPLTGTAVGMDEDGALLIRDDEDGVHALMAGDVVHLRPAREAR